MEDTEWNEILRAKGILPPKEEPVEEEEIHDPVDPRTQMTADEIDLLLEEDMDDERILENIR